MFRAEKTATYSWQRLLDENDKLIGHINELSSGDWSVCRLGHRGYDRSEWLGDKEFSSGPKAATWVWKNRFDLGEPYSTYPEPEGKAPKKVVSAPVVPTLEPTEDLFWDYTK